MDATERALIEAALDYENHSGDAQSNRLINRVIEYRAAHPTGPATEPAPALTEDRVNAIITKRLDTLEAVLAGTIRGMQDKILALESPRTPNTLTELRAAAAQMVEHYGPPHSGSPRNYERLYHAIRAEQAQAGKEAGR